MSNHPDRVRRNYGSAHFCYRCHHDCNCPGFHMLDCEGCTGCETRPRTPSNDMLQDVDPTDENDYWGV